MLSLESSDTLRPSASRYARNLPLFSAFALLCTYRVYQLYEEMSRERSGRAGARLERFPEAGPQSHRHVSAYSRAVAAVTMAPTRLLCGYGETRGALDGPEPKCC